MILTAIRHTSVDVPSGICYGISDVSPAASFREESASIGVQLRGQDFSKIYSSPLKRCTQLASVLFPEAEITTDWRLRELDFGDWEMQSWEAVFNSPEGKTWFGDYLRADCPNGESFADLMLRVDWFLEELEAAENEQIAIVTHSGVIRALMCLLQQKTAEEAFNTRLEFGQVVWF